MLTFFPGPSRIEPAISTYLQQAVRQDILSISHRSKQFVALSEHTLSLLHHKLQIPEDYQIVYTGSATECWQIINQSLLANQESVLHILNGSFGSKWYEYSAALAGTRAIKQTFDIQETCSDALKKISDSAKSASILCLTHNETSNGTALSDQDLQHARAAFGPETLLACDVTSSIAGVSLPWLMADIWFGSVQKCFGLPAGLGLMICSPKAIQKAQELNHKGHYNSLVVLLEHIKNYQTSYTPNVLGIYLLNRVLEARAQIGEVEQILANRAALYYALIEQDWAHKAGFEPLIKNPNARSTTVIAVAVAEPDRLAKLKSDAQTSDMLLGNGYGNWKENSFRIANFPAIQQHEFEKMTGFLSQQMQNIS